MTPGGLVPILLDLGDSKADGIEVCEDILADLGMTVHWWGNGPAVSGDAVSALYLEQVGQVHLDLESDRLVRVLGVDGPLAAASALRTRFGEAGLICLVDWSEGRMEGGADVFRTWDNPWWVSEILGGDPSIVDPDGILGKGAVVALADHPVDRSHPALVDRCLPPIEAWRLPWYEPRRVLPDDHGTGGAGLVAGWDRAAGKRTGVAPGAMVLPVHLWPGPGSGLRPDRIRILCRALDSVRQRQLRSGTDRWIFTQQISLTNLTFGRALQEQYDDALVVLERAYARAAGDWGLAVLSAAGSHPRADWPVLPCGLAGVTAVGAVDEKGATLRRSPRFGLDLVCCVSKGGRGPLSCAAGGGYLEQGQATSAAAPLAAGALAALASCQTIGLRRALRLLRRRTAVVSGGASLVSVRPWISKGPRRPSLPGADARTDPATGHGTDRLP